MTNPNNAIGTNGAFSGRTSPNALNDILGAFSKGIVSGWTCSPKTGMTVQLGGSASTRDVALAEDNAGNKLTIDNRSGAPVEVTLGGAPSTNNRIDAIVAYVDNPSTGDDTTTDNPSTCGIIAVSGTVAANPTAPSDGQIRAAITTDGATGGVAYYVVLATILVGTNVTTIGSGVITPGASAQSLADIADGSITADKLAASAVTTDKVDWADRNVIIDSTPSISTFLGGSYSKQFTVPVAGYYKIDTAFCAMLHRKSNSLNALDIKIDGTTIASYTYASETTDTEWGNSRRNITSYRSIVALTAGTHTLTTIGNLSYDSGSPSASSIGTFTAEYFSPSN